MLIDYVRDYVRNHVRDYVRNHVRDYVRNHAFVPLSLVLLALTPMGCAPDEPATTGGPGSTTSTTDAVDGTTTSAASADSTTSDAPSTSDGPPPSGIEIVPGVGIGELAIGDRGDRLAELAGEPSSTLRFGNLALLTFDAAALEVVLAAPAGEELTSSAVVLSLGALLSSEVEFFGPALPGQFRDDIVAASGAPSESIEDTDFYEAGWSVAYRSNDSARVVVVFAPYTLDIVPPAMAPIGAAK